MEDTKQESLTGTFRDLELTKSSDGRRVLIDAFAIASISEQDEGCRVTLKVPVANGARHEIKYGLQFKVQESYDEIKRMRQSLK